MITLKLTEKEAMVLYGSIVDEVNTLENCDPNGSKKTIKILEKVNQKLMKALA